MTVSARLSREMQLALTRYCRAHGLTKTQAIERGLAMLRSSEGQRDRHPAFAVYKRLRPQLGATADSRSSLESIESLKRHLDEKYPA